MRAVIKIFERKLLLYYYDYFSILMYILCCQVSTGSVRPQENVLLFKLLNSDLSSAF